MSRCASKIDALGITGRHYLAEPWRSRAERLANFGPVHWLREALRIFGGGEEYEVKKKLVLGIYVQLSFVRLLQWNLH